MTVRINKHLKLTVIYAGAFIIAGLVILFGMALLVISNSCDEAAGKTASNQRGDIVEERLRICTGVGTTIDHSIMILPLRPSFVWKTITLAKYDPVTEAPPAFRWTDDNELSIDLGEVRAVWGRVNRVGSIRITYSYTYSNVE